MTSKSTMIVQTFSSKRPAPPPPTSRYCPNDRGVYTYISKREKDRAESLKLTVEEYRRRVAMVIKVSNSCPYQVGDTLWPKDTVLQEEYGQCQVINIVRHYDDYGEVEWVEPPLILGLRAKNFPAVLTYANLEWCIKNKEQDVC